jgi:predicted nuclease with RNAse H fold
LQLSFGVRLHLQYRGQFCLLLIGLDCATEDARIGIARGSSAGDVVCVQEIVVCGKEASAAARVAAWLEDASVPTVLAIDAPLGWPGALGRALSNHRAGDEITAPANELFRRATDRFIQQHLKKTPLDVGADRIARTAHAALRILGELRRRLGKPIPLAWSGEVQGVAAIEVYPAATLISRGVRAGGYKKPANEQERSEIIQALSRELDLGTHAVVAQTNADALDASICVLAAADFVLGHAAPPEDQNAALSEGWIWTRIPSVQPL